MSQKLTIAIETSGRVGSAAIGQGNKLISETFFSGFMRHGAELYPTLDKMLHHVHARPEDIEEVYITGGPGSFTGLRIAVTAAKMFYLTQKAQIIAADTMDVIAENATRYIGKTGHKIDCIAVVLDAKKDLFYAAVFDRINENWEKCLETQLFSAEKLMKWLQANKKNNVGLLGEGLVYYADKFNAPYTYLLDKSYWSASAGGLFRVGKKMADAKKYAEPFELIPKYIREADAVVKRQRA